MTSRSKMTRDDLRALVESNRDKICAGSYGGFDREDNLCALLGREIQRGVYDGAYHGEQASLFAFDCGSVLITCSYFGSCSYCDLWQSIDSEADAYYAARIEILNGLLFADFCEAHHYLTNIEDSNRPPEVLRIVKELIPYIEGRLENEV